MNVHRRISFLLVGLLLVAALSLGCRPHTVDPINPRVLILSPSAESTISGSSVTVRVYVQNFEVVPEGQDSSTYASGRIIYYMDVDAPQRPGEDAMTGEGTYVVSTDTSHTWTDVSTGEHVFSVQLVTVDNTTLQPPVISRTPVTVQ